MLKVFLIGLFLNLMILEKGGVNIGGYFVYGDCVCV